MTAIEASGAGALRRSDLMNLETYAEQRPEFRRQILAHKKHRSVHLGDNLTITFEDRRTIQYQIQEMLRIERIFEAEGIEDELDAYNPLIPDGDNLKATLLIEFADVAERKQALAGLIGVEAAIWIEIDGRRVLPICDEDLERATDEKTSAVHFMRWQFDAGQIAAARAGAAIVMGVDHPNMQVPGVTLSEPQRAALAADFG